LAQVKAFLHPPLVPPEDGQDDQRGDADVPVVLGRRLSDARSELGAAAAVAYASQRLEECDRRMAADAARQTWLSQRAFSLLAGLCVQAPEMQDACERTAQPGLLAARHGLREHGTDHLIGFGEPVGGCERLGSAC
jgi:hypothetical protein